MARYVIGLVLVLTLPSPAARADHPGILEHWHGQLRFTFDELTLPADERMGLVGGNYLLSVGPLGYFGLGSYGAVSGDRGGFFTGGVAAGLRLPVGARWALDGGLFVGGGGGGAAPQGGGLMLRPHASLVWQAGPWGIGAGYSEVRFPNGNIHSSQWTLTLERRVQSLLAAGWPEPGDLPRGVQAVERHHPTRLNRQLFALQGLAYFPMAGVQGRGGQALDQRMDIIGIRWRRIAPSGLAAEFETGGAWGGRVDGFAQVLGGVAWLPRFGRWRLGGGLLVGAAGGGDVDTGGGVLFRPYAAALAAFTRRWSLAVELGYTGAPQGDFEAWVATAGLTYGFDALGLGGDGRVAGGAQDYGWARWRVRTSSQRYVAHGDMRKGSNEGTPVDLVSVKTDTFLTPRWYLTGQALGAYAGEAGGYAVGLVGGGWRGPAWRAVRPWLEAAAGAAGGGGIAVGGGYVVQPSAGLAWSLTRAVALEASAGWIHAPSSTLSAPVLDVGLSYRFASVHRRR